MLKIAELIYLGVFTFFKKQNGVKSFTLLRKNFICILTMSQYFRYSIIIIYRSVAILH